MTTRYNSFHKTIIYTLKNKVNSFTSFLTEIHIESVSILNWSDRESLI